MGFFWEYIKAFAGKAGVAATFGVLVAWANVHGAKYGVL